MLRRSKVTISWSPSFAYAIGLIATDGNLSPDGRHINFVSKDIEQVNNYKKCLGIKNRISKKSRGGDPDNKKYYVVQFGDKNFYEYLNTIGLFTNKSKTIKSIKVPDKYFVDLLRGCLDGDGNIDIFINKESKQPQVRTRFSSGSKAFLLWMLIKVRRLCHIDGGWLSGNNKSGAYSLTFGKSDSIRLFDKMYYDGAYPYLTRKYEIMKACRGGEIGYTR